ncbi:uncharacterized protein LOC115071342 [Nannospalax galili]|uniref:uncharacterized protein LOC115071342 n=1 Tax=Nannospalax galili TaxID=1026970 RepID=UPI00111C7673|nr:uncharacterized protein LOC115071342 [Nannospalax galili]
MCSCQAAFSPKDDFLKASPSIHPRWAPRPAAQEPSTITPPENELPQLTRKRKRGTPRPSPPPPHLAGPGPGTPRHRSFAGSGSATTAAVAKGANTGICATGRAENPARAAAAAARLGALGRRRRWLQGLGRAQGNRRAAALERAAASVREELLPVLQMPAQRPEPENAGRHKNQYASPSLLECGRRMLRTAGVEQTWSRELVCALAGFGFSWNAVGCQSCLACQATSNINPPGRKVELEARRAVSWCQTPSLLRSGQAWRSHGFGSEGP